MPAHLQQEIENVSMKRRMAGSIRKEQTQRKVEGKKAKNNAKQEKSKSRLMSAKDLVSKTPVIMIDKALDTDSDMQSRLVTS
jgi:hypothetical protein